MAKSKSKLKKKVKPLKSKYLPESSLIWSESVCMNPLKFLAFSCPECSFHVKCNARCKDDYSKKPKKSKEEEVSVMLTPPEEMVIKKPKNTKKVEGKKNVKEVKPKVKKTVKGKRKKSLST